MWLQAAAPAGSCCMHFAAHHGHVCMPRRRQWQLPVALGTCTCVRSSLVVRDRLEIGHPIDGEIKAASTKRGVDDLKLAFGTASRSVSKMSCPTLGGFYFVPVSTVSVTLQYLRYLRSSYPIQVGIPSVPAENERPLHHNFAPPYPTLTPKCTYRSSFAPLIDTQRANQCTAHKTIQATMALRLTNWNHSRESGKISAATKKKSQRKKKERQKKRGWAREPCSLQPSCRTCIATADLPT